MKNNETLKLSNIFKDISSLINIKRNKIEGSIKKNVKNSKINSKTNMINDSLEKENSYENNNEENNIINSSDSNKENEDFIENKYENNLSNEEYDLKNQIIDLNKFKYLRDSKYKFEIIPSKNHKENIIESNITFKPNGKYESNLSEKYNYISFNDEKSFKTYELIEPFILYKQDNIPKINNLTMKQAIDVNNSKFDILLKKNELVFFVKENNIKLNFPYDNNSKFEIIVNDLLINIKNEINKPNLILNELKIINKYMVSNDCNTNNILIRFYKENLNLLKYYLDKNESINEILFEIIKNCIVILYWKINLINKNIDKNQIKELINIISTNNFNKSLCINLLNKFNMKEKNNYIFTDTNLEMNFGFKLVTNYNFNNLLEIQKYNNNLYILEENNLIFFECYDDSFHVYKTNFVNNLECFKFWNFKNYKCMITYYKKDSKILFWIINKNVFELFYNLEIKMNFITNIDVIENLDLILIFGLNGKIKIINLTTLKEEYTWNLNIKIFKNSYYIFENKIFFYHKNKIIIVEFYREDYKIINSIVFNKYNEIKDVKIVNDEKNLIMINLTKKIIIYDFKAKLKNFSININQNILKSMVINMSDFYKLILISDEFILINYNLDKLDFTLISKKNVVIPLKNKNNILSEIVFNKYNKSILFYNYSNTQINKLKITFKNK